MYDRFRRHADKTFGQAAARYLNEYRGRNQERAAYAIEAVRPYIADKRLIDVDDEAMEPFKEDRLNGRGPFKRPAMAGTVNRELSTVTAILRKASRVWRWIPEAPQILYVEGARKRSIPLTWEEQDALFAQLPQRWAEGMALFAVNTGVREQELLGLEWSDMVPVPSLETFVFVLNRTKNGESRAVICNSLAKLAVERQRGNGSQYVFPSRSPANYGGRMASYVKPWNKAWQAAGLPTGDLIKQGIHNLRFTFATRLRGAGVPKEARNALLGHHRTNIEEHYALPDIAQLLPYAELVTERRESVVLRAVSGG